MASRWRQIRLQINRHRRLQRQARGRAAIVVGEDHLRGAHGFDEWALVQHSVHHAFGEQRAADPGEFVANQDGCVLTLERLQRACNAFVANRKIVDAA
ncbi:hypothetical protein M3I54_24035 [Paraburkholderia sp. CNPSo 3274]|uniref:hypothetical protein n=1 Tax=Paraburkholderia sp. CNPSo 3274 TaxID=2940932 RepID=UPI0020B8BC3C|nr:hypothetical protein [Paraburkholderia sp. CNPSo 3274]MCP3710013.1 hypothetical protein [Paraburkholderia sp. CNPSo 3274]